MPPIDIIILAVLAGFIIWRLRSVLGTREGHEPDPYQARREAKDQLGGNDNVVQMPGTQAADEPNFDHIAPAGSELAQGLTEVQLADRTFTPDGFVDGARQAYEMIVTAFASGDRRTLRPLLDDETYGDFDSALSARDENGETVEMTFIGLESAKITAAAVRGRVADITVRFVSEIISLTKNNDGIVIEGDPQTVRKVTDVWTFSRDTTASDPNWLLVATDEG